MGELLFKNLYRIPSTRLPYWDYSQDGWYFITVCTKKRKCVLGNVKNYKMQLSPLGEIVQDCWLDLTRHYLNCRLESFVIMPNHVHGIITIDNPDIPNPLIKQHSLSEIVRGFKTFSARKINESCGTTGQPFWQTRFYEHIIRNRDAMYKISKYILNNPAKWELDRENPKNFDF